MQLPITIKNNTFTKLSSRIFSIEKDQEIFPISREFFYEFTPREIPNNNTKRKFTKTIGLHFGGGFAQRKLENNYRESDAYFKMREDTETSQGVIQFGINAGVKHHSGVGISTGLHFSQIIETFRFKGNTTETIFDKNGIVAYQLTLAGDTIPIIDSLIYDQEWAHNKRFNNFYRMLDVPILLGYEKDFGNWSFGLRGGVFVNLLLKTEGMVFDEDFDFVYLEKNQEQIFSNKIGMSYYLGGVGKYHLKNNFSITIQPHFRFFPKSITKSDSWTSQKYNLVSLDLGIEYGF